MSVARAAITVEGSISSAETLWYDVRRWPSFVDGVSRVAKVEGDWPDVGSSVQWDSVAGGRGRVREVVEAYELRVGQTVRTEDEASHGTQTVSFTPGDEGLVVVTVELDYRVKQRTPFTPIVDALFIRRAQRESLRHTLSRFAIELRSDHEL